MSIHHDSIHRQHSSQGFGASVAFAAFVGYALIFALNAVVARILAPDQFGEFAAAVAMIGIICTCATLGLEKYALRLLPQYIQERKLALVSGFLAFGVIISVVLGAVIGFVGFKSYGAFKPHTNNIEEIAHMIWFAPAIAVFLFAVEIASAFGSFVWSAIIYRVIFPLIALGSMAALPLLTAKPTTADAINVYGFSWIIALGLMAILLLRSAPRRLYRSKPMMIPRQWITEGVAYLGLSLLLTVFAQGAILTTEVIRGDRVSVGLISAAMQVSMLVVIVQTSTLRVFGPQLATLIARGDAVGERKLIWNRARWMLLIGLLFMAAIVLYGRAILSIFGESYTVAYPVLVVLSIGNTVNTVLGFSPTILQFHGAHKVTLRIATIGTIIGVGSMSLAAAYGTHLEVAYAYSGSLILMYLAFQVAAQIVSRRSAATVPNA